MPINKTPTASTAGCLASTQIARAHAPTAAAPISDLRSPKREVIMAAGILHIKEPKPISAAIRPDTACEAPRAIALSAITGNIAPLDMPNNKEGPKAGITIWLQRKGVSVI